MRLDELLDRPDWTAVRLAREVRKHMPRSARKTTPSTIGRLLRAGSRKQVRTASVELALAIEKATDGLVRAQEVPLSAEAKRVMRVLRAPQPQAPEPEPDGAGAAA